MTEKYAIINGYQINYCKGAGVWEIVEIKTGTEVGYKNNREAAEKFAIGCRGDGSGKTWQKCRLWS